MEYGGLATQFAGAQTGSRFSNVLPFWSRVEHLTIHTRTGINPAAGNPATNPVTLIDVALSEGLVRKLAQGMNSVPAAPAAAQAFETANATPSELSAIQLGVSFERSDDDSDSPDSNARNYRTGVSRYARRRETR